MVSGFIQPPPDAYGFQVWQEPCPRRWVVMYRGRRQYRNSLEAVAEAIQDILQEIEGKTK